MRTPLVISDTVVSSPSCLPTLLTSFFNLFSFPFPPPTSHSLSHSLSSSPTLPLPFSFSLDPEHSCEDGDIRLADGKTKNEGRVEICFEDHWGTVCGHLFTNVDASVVCRQLGFEPQGTSIYICIGTYVYYVKAISLKD